MYSSRNRKWRGILITAAVLVLLAALGIFLVFRNSGKNLEENTEAAIRSAVQRTALECYTVEGAFPQSLEYMEENYGLQINTRRYLVVYEAYASNMPPTVRVIRIGSR